jgi:hypothetical protein
VRPRWVRIRVPTLAHHHPKGTRAWPNTLPGATPTVLAASPENLLNGMLLASMAVRGIGGAAPQGRPTITMTVAPRGRVAATGADSALAAAESWPLPLSVGRTRM